jgi:peroxiredoxin Q/BCP
MKEMKTETEKVTIGSRIPDFELPDHDGKLFRIKDLIGTKSLVIYFYPKDETAGCTRQACSFRDEYEAFKEADAEVIGISSDTPQSHSEFMKNHRLPFILLSDENKTVRRMFNVPGNLLGLLDGRVTYIVDKQGIVRHIFNSQLRIDRHIDESLKILRELK